MPGTMRHANVYLSPINRMDAVIASTFATKSNKFFQAKGENSSQINDSIWLHSAYMQGFLRNNNST